MVIQETLKNILALPISSTECHVRFDVVVEGFIREPKKIICLALDRNCVIIVKYVVVPLAGWKCCKCDDSDDICPIQGDNIIFWGRRNCSFL
ncbi:hypothetical protein FRX31_026932 [Thalictrum thalictroides]|uniref:Uncharacterized protein n=1 Tax=Thalictrum thalictroides TaxID=46969 RepID=A0A7J6VH38_THATH|nr:hypothetical protein FRX31_026932 [Thalictrum thalictroides]